MRSFWALPAFLRLALASAPAFSVFDDLLAFPQYEVVFPDTFVTEDYATSRLANSASRATPSPIPDSKETQELSKPNRQATGNAGQQGDISPDDVDKTYEALLLHGQRYLCSIPIVTAEQNATTNAEQAKDEEEKELMRATDRGWELLQGMQGQCIYFLSGWWSYSFCYKDQVKQFHQLPPSRGVPLYPPVEDTSVKSFILGKFPGDKGKSKGGHNDETRKTLDAEAEPDDAKSSIEVAKLETKGTSRYMVQRLAGGTECDLTGKDRKIEVQFHCNPQSSDRIAMIKEIATCSYLMVIHTPRLCNDVAFMPPSENRANPIACHPVLSEKDIDQWTAAKLEGNMHETEDFLAIINEAEEKSKRPIIGGIEVGAQKLVGSEGKVIEKSVVAGGGKEIYVGTVATSDGKMMSKEEMRKLKTDIRDVEKLKKDLNKYAGNKGWKLDLVDTPRGREFRGIIDADPEEEGEEKKTEQGGDTIKKDGDKGESAEEPSQEGSEEVYKDEL